MFSSKGRFVCRLHIGIINGFKPLVVRDIFDKRLHLTQSGFDIFQFAADASVGAVNVLGLLLKVSILQKVVLSQIVESSRGLFEDRELRLMLVSLAANELDSLLNIADERESLTSVLYLTLAASASLNISRTILSMYVSTRLAI